jgi:hypothetical protein
MSFEMSKICKGGIPLQYHVLEIRWFLNLFKKWYLIFVFSDRRSRNTKLIFNLDTAVHDKPNNKLFLKQLKTSDLKERNIFILLLVFNKLQSIQSLKEALGYRIVNKWTITNYSDEYDFNQWKCYFERCRSVLITQINLTVE